MSEVEVMSIIIVRVLARKFVGLCLRWLFKECGNMIEVYLYGKLRRFTDNLDPSRDSVTHVNGRKGDSIADITRRIGIPDNEIGPIIFLNGRYSPLSRKVNDGDRLGIFPDNMPMIIV